MLLVRRAFHFLSGQFVYKLFLTLPWRIYALSRRCWQAGSSCRNNLPSLCLSGQPQRRYFLRRRLSPSIRLLAKNSLVPCHDSRMWRYFWNYPRRSFHKSWWNLRGSSSCSYASTSCICLQSDSRPFHADRETLRWGRRHSTLAILRRSWSRWSSDTTKIPVPMVSALRCSPASLLSAELSSPWWWTFSFRIPQPASKQFCLHERLCFRAVF